MSQRTINSFFKTASRPPAANSNTAEAAAGNGPSGATAGDASGQDEQRPAKRQRTSVAGCEDQKGKQGLQQQQQAEPATLASMPGRRGRAAPAPGADVVDLIDVSSQEDPATEHRTTVASPTPGDATGGPPSVSKLGPLPTPAPADQQPRPGAAAVSSSATPATSQKVPNAQGRKLRQGGSLQTPASAAPGRCNPADTGRNGQGGEEEAGAQRAQSATPASAVKTPAPASQLPSASRAAPLSSERKETARRKLAQDYGRAARMEPQGAAAGGAGTGPAAGGSATGAKLTPLEQQVVELKERHPGILLVVEVGHERKRGVLLSRAAELAAGTWASAQDKSAGHEWVLRPPCHPPANPWPYSFRRLLHGWVRSAGGLQVPVLRRGR